MERSEALAEVRELAEALGELERALHEAVAEARAAGASWALVGQALGVSRQSAHERFHR